MNKAIFLDRDGVINKKLDGYVTNIDKFEFLPDVEKTLKILIDNNFLLIIITNQSAINRGIISEEILNEIHSYMENHLKLSDVKISKIYFCPHMPEEHCLCRKPNSLLLEKAIQEFNVDVNQSWFVGDQKTDMEAAKKVGVKSLLLEKDQNISNILRIVLSNSE